MEDQAEQHQKWWQKNKKLLMRTVLIALLAIVIVLIILIILGYILNWDWTGLNATDLTSTPQKPTSILVYQPGKTLWDWLQLLIIPAFIAFGAVWLTAQQNHDREIAREQHEHDLNIAVDNQREAVLQTYLDKMTEFLLEKNLRESQAEDEVRKIAHVRTLAVLPGLDNRRKGIVLQFLYESDLINQNIPIIPLSGADLSGADLSGTFNKAFPWAVYQDIVDTPWENPTAQYGANLSGANLWGAILNGANLSRALQLHL